MIPLQPAAAAGAAPWRPSHLLSAPHRLGFFAAAVVLALAALWWAAVMFTRAAGLPVPWATPPLVAHGLLMSLGFMPLFIVGFLFTAGPRWLVLPGLPARRLLPPVLLMLGGWLLAVPGFHAALPLAALGLAGVAAGWGALVWRFGVLVRASPAPDRLHATLITGACAAGVFAAALAAWALATGSVTGARAAVQIALWFFLAPVFATVSHRMIPFFTASALPMLDAWRPNWLLWSFWALLLASGAAALAELITGPLPLALRWVQVAYEAPAAVLLLWLARRWGAVQSLKLRLLAMLHGGFLWFGLACALAAASHALLALSGGERSLGLAPLHALTMGYLGTTLIAMITRVAAGHSGRPLAADAIAWRLYLVVQLAVLLRVAAAIATPLEGALLAASGLAWAVGAAGWAWRYGGWLGRPRADGRPG